MREWSELLKQTHPNYIATGTTELSLDSEPEHESSQMSFESLETSKSVDTLMKVVSEDERSGSKDKKNCSIEAETSVSGEVASSSRDDMANVHDVEKSSILHTSPIELDWISPTHQLSEKITQIPDRFGFKIGEVAEIVGVKDYVLRYWESEFTSLQPKKAKNGQRMYSQKDVASALMIKKLLHEDRFSVEGARLALKKLKKQIRSAGEVNSAEVPVEGSSSVPVASIDAVNASPSAVNNGHSPLAPVSLPTEPDCPSQYCASTDYGSEDSKSVESESMRSESVKSELPVSEPHVLGHAGTDEVDFKNRSGEEPVLLKGPTPQEIHGVKTAILDAIENARLRLAL